MSTPRFWRDLSKEDREKVRSELRDAYAEGDYPAIAALVTEFVELDMPVRDIIPLVLDTGSFNYGDELSFKLKEGVRAWMLTDGARAVRDEISYGEIKPEKVRLSAFPTAYKPDLQAGNVQSLLDLESDVAQAFTKITNFYVWNMLVSAVTAGSTNWGYIAGSSLTAAALNTAISYVQDTAGTAAAIVGRATTLDAIMGFSGFDQETTREIRMTGQLGVYRGATIIGLQQIKDDYGLRKRGANLIDTTEVMVVGGGVGVFRDTPVQDEEWNDVPALHWGRHFYKWIIGTVLHSDRLYRITLSG